MKIAIFGVSGMIGQRIAAEALRRGHSVTGIVRDPGRVTLSDDNLHVVQGNVLDPAQVAELVAGHDVVVISVQPQFARGETDTQMFVQAAHSAHEGLQQAGVDRLIVVGGAGSLEVAPGVQLVDTPEFPADWKPLAKGLSDALNVYRTFDDLDWTFVSPAALIEPGDRTGTYRTGRDQLVADEQGQSRISAEDYAVAILDEIEQPSFVQQRFTVAY